MSYPVPRTLLPWLLAWLASHLSGFRVNVVAFLRAAFWDPPEKEGPRQALRATILSRGICCSLRGPHLATFVIAHLPHWPAPHKRLHAWEVGSLVAS